MKKKILIIVATIIVIVLLVGGAFIYGKYSANKSNDKKGQTAASATVTAKVSPTATSVKTKSATVSATASSSQSSESEWLTFNNYANKYTIKYPPEAKIENGSATESEKGKVPKDAACVKISTDNYYVLIGPVPDENNPIFCFRTGVGTEWLNGPSDTVTAAGMSYTVDGMHTEAASAGNYEDFFLISPVDNRVKIEYGTSVNEKYGTITKVQAKDTVHKIVAEYSPAE